MNTFVTREELQDYGQQLGQEIVDAVIAWDNNRDRTKQAQARILGMSNLGGCREFIRATVAGDPKGETTRLNLPAIVGTALGDVVEKAAVAHIPGMVAQGKVRVTLPKSGITVEGSTDLRKDRKNVIDLKSKDGLDGVQYEGPGLDNLVQLSGYMVGLLQADEVDDDATGHLVYMDRSGRDRSFWTYSITMEEAHGYLAAADERLEEVAVALQTGEVASYLRDKPESWCFAVGCEFYKQCWDGYQPDGRLHPDEEKLVALYDAGRALAKQGANMQREAKAKLYTDPENNVQGVGRKLQIKWVPTASRNGVYDKIDVREVEEHLATVEESVDEEPY